MAMRSERVEFDATNEPLGRLAANVAKALRGKHRPDFTPHAAPHVEVIVKHLKAVSVSPRRLSAKLYRYSGYPGGLKSRTFGEAFARDPERTFRLVVKRMLPENRQRRLLLRNLTFTA